MRFSPLLMPATVFILAVQLSAAQIAGQGKSLSADSDHDGLSDDLEQALLVQFLPTFEVGEHDCSNTAAEFRPGIRTPMVERENGTIYGQVTPGMNSKPEHPTVEIRFYHLWKRDCGAHGHPLDAEHVAVLVQASGSDLSSAHWQALYWYAAAHEGTACDVSQITRAPTLGPDDRGVTVWISPGKHASYISEAACHSGCGADRCERMVPLVPGKLINLGEVDHPMNDSTFISSPSWPLAQKMGNTNFPANSLARLDRLPLADIALFNPGRHPAQGVIAISNSTEQAITGAGHKANTAISVADDATGTALATATASSGNALHKTYSKTKRWLGTSYRNVANALSAPPS